MSNEREYWIKTLVKISEPVLSLLADDKLKESMPVDSVDKDRSPSTYLEAFARTLVGIAPWLESNPINQEEKEIKDHFCNLARKSLYNATEQSSKDKMSFLDDYDHPQAIVDAAFLAHAILRAPNELWNKCDEKTKSNVIKCMKSTRRKKPNYNNWLLFSAIIETFLFMVNEDYDPMRIDYAIRQFNNVWYAGDGMYNDGVYFSLDYYNSFVIQPMIIQILDTLGGKNGEWGSFQKPVIERAKRYSELQERLIGPDGSFAVLGRSICYRMGAFQHLADMSLRELLPESLSPAQVRCALTAVIKRCIEAPNTFDNLGFLKIGLCGYQPSLRESYISTGSLYLCSTIFLPLGLDENNEFWSADDTMWTSQKIWSGFDGKADKSI